MSDRNEVVITGIGLVTPLGATTEQNWQAALQGKSGLTSYHHPLVDILPCKVAGIAQVDPARLDAIFSTKNQRKTERFVHLGLLAGHQAIEDAGLSATFPQNRERFGVYLGVGVGGLKTIMDSSVAFQAGGPRKVSPFMLPKAISNEAASWLSMTLDLQGPMVVAVSACSSSADALGLAYRVIKDGYADYMLVGGTESCITPESISAFGNMRALSSWKGAASAASRPFSQDRTGFVMGEGAGVVVLERKDLAEKRGANMYAQIVGYGSTSDAYHITAMHPEGRGAQNAIRSALEQANLQPQDIGYINAHGTGTPMNDAVESKVIRSVFGAYSDPTTDKHLLVSSTKSMTGHMLGAAGGVEVSFAALALKHQVVPPTINLDTVDPECKLDFVANVAREHSFNAALSHSFGFGGGNAVIALKRI